MIELATALYLLLAATGLALAVSYAGLPVLGQGAFVAVGGVGTALLADALPLPLAVVAAVCVAGVLGLLVGLAAARLSGAPLGLATWALAWLVYEALLAFPDLAGGAQGLVRPTPAVLVNPLLGLTLTLTPGAHVVLAGLLCAVALLGLRRLAAGPAGTDLAALREDPALAASLGVPVGARRRAVLTTTAVLGGLSGAGTVVLLGLVAPADVSPLLSLQLFVAVLLGGTARWWGPVVGVAVLSALPPVADALASAAGLAPERARGVLTAALLVAALGLRSRLPSPRRTGVTVPEVEPSGRAAWSPVLLRADGVRVAYGSVQALDGASVALRAGQVHALVGPNGSGKSTLLAVLAGDVRPDAGTVEVAGAAGHGSVRAGVARTPQRTVLPPEAAGVQVAVGVARPRTAVLRHLLATPSSRAAAGQRGRTVGAALTLTGLHDVAQSPPERLTVGQQRLLQVARVVATGAPVLLLDEPAAGMSAAERAQLADVLRRLAASGRAVLLVEHDLRLVAEVADRVTVLSGGRVLASGHPATVRADPAVRAAYLGTRISS